MFCSAHFRLNSLSFLDRRGLGRVPADFPTRTLLQELNFYRPDVNALSLSLSLSLSSALRI